MEIGRVDMCVGIKQDIISHYTHFSPEVTGVICEPVNTDAYFNACNSSHFRATNMRHMVVKAMTGRIGAAMIFDSVILHSPGFQLIYSPSRRVARLCLDFPFGGNVCHWSRKLNIGGGDQITVRPMTFSDCLGCIL